MQIKISYHKGENNRAPRSDVYKDVTQWDILNVGYLYIKQKDLTEYYIDIDIIKKVTATPGKPAITSIAST